MFPPQSRFSEPGLHQLASAAPPKAAQIYMDIIPQRNAFEVISTDGERNRIVDSERRDFMGGVAKAKHLLVLSHFSKAELELAERTKMQVVRVKSENGKRMAIVRPSCFLSEAGDAAPTTMGGQALLAEYGLN